MSAAARAPICHSDAASTIVSALRSRAWKAGSFLRCCSSGSPQMGLLAERPRFRKAIVLRGLQSLPVRFVRT